MFYKAKMPIGTEEVIKKQLGFDKRMRRKWKVDQEKIRRQGERTLAHLVDAALRWNACGRTPADSKMTEDILPTISRIWIHLHGPKSKITSDGEKGLDSDLAAAWAGLQGIELDLKAPREHVQIVERFNGLLREQLRKAEEQLLREGITIPFEQLLDTCIFYINLLTHIGRATPYQAL